MPSENDLNLRLARFNHEVVDLESILDRQVKLLNRVVQALEQELVVDTAGGKIRHVDVDTIRKLKDLTAALNSATDSQTRLDKSAKDRAKRMTDDERTEAAARWILKFPYEQRRSTLLKLINAHNADVKEKKAAGVFGATSLSQVDIT